MISHDNAIHTNTFWKFEKKTIKISNVFKKKNQKKFTSKARMATGESLASAQAYANAARSMHANESFVTYSLN